MAGRNESQIVRVRLGKANAYFVIGENRVLLVDTGTRGSEKKILRFLEDLGLSPSNIELIIITHTHYDHAGSAKALKDMTGAGIAVHQDEANCLREGYGGFPKGTSLLTRAVSWVGTTLGKRVGRYGAVSPDSTVGERFGLEEYGINGYILPTPGHTSGSISVIVQDKFAIVGDTLFNVFRKSLFPPFADDRDELLRSWKKLLDTGCERFYPGHGSPFGKDRMMDSWKSSF